MAKLTKTVEYCRWCGAPAMSSVYRHMTGIIERMVLCEPCKRTYKEEEHHECID